MSSGINKKSVLSYFSKHGKKLILILIALISIMMIISSIGSEGDAESISLPEYKKRLEREIEELCASVDGVGDCKVTVTFETGETYEYRGSNVISSSPPRVLGVTVICEGGGSPEVRERISSAMKALFDIGTNRVCVLKMEK